MTSKLDNQELQKEQVENIPYHETKEYQDKIFSFLSETQQHFKKDTANALKRASGARFGRSMQFSPDNVTAWLQSPVHNEVNLRLFSNFLYDTNSLYRWFITTMANMPTWSWLLSMDTYGTKKAVDKKEKMYRQGLQYIDGKNIEYEMAKAFLIAVKNDFFYGYEVENNGYYFVMNLDPDFCRINRQVGDGIYGFQFNFAYFDSKLNMDERSSIISSYPLEFQAKYNQYRLDKGTGWIDLDVDNTICLKMNDEVLYGLPYYANLFSLLVDLGFYKDLAKERAEIDNFLLLHQRIPVDENALDKFAINLQLAQSFDAIANSVLPEGVNMFTSPMEVGAVKTERSTNDNSKVKDALSQVFTGGGQPQALSNSDNSTTAGVAKAIIVNEQIVYRFYRQVEKVYNYKLKNKFPSTKYKFKLQDITNFSKPEKTKDLLSLAQSGLSTPMAVASASGVNPNQFLNDVDLEYDVLGLSHKLRPLQTSHTMNGNDVEAHTGGVGNKGGAPTVADGDLSGAGDVTRENEGNVVDT